MIGQRSAGNLLLLVAGLVVWSSAFVALYAALSVGCAFGWEGRPFAGITLQRAVLIGIWIAHLGVLALLVLYARRRARRAAPDDEVARFFGRVVLGAAVVSTAVTLVNYAPILGLSTCL